MNQNIRLISGKSRTIMVNSWLWICMQMKIPRLNFKIQNFPELINLPASVGKKGVCTKRCMWLHLAGDSFATCNLPGGISFSLYSFEKIIFPIANTAAKRPLQTANFAATQRRKASSARPENWLTRVCLRREWRPQMLWTGRREIWMLI